MWSGRLGGPGQGKWPLAMHTVTGWECCGELRKAPSSLRPPRTLGSRHEPSQWKQIAENSSWELITALNFIPYKFYPFNAAAGSSPERRKARSNPVQEVESDRAAWETAGSLLDAGFPGMFTQHLRKETTQHFASC